MTHLLISEMDARRDFCHFITFFELFMIYSSILHMLALALDRVIIARSIVALRLSILKRAGVRRTVGGCWLLAALLSVPLLGGEGWDTRNDANTLCWSVCGFPYDAVSNLSMLMHCCNLSPI